jgi:hypothetical protein
MLSSALKSIARDKPDTAASILETLAKKGSPGYAVLAQFNQAAVLAKKGEVKAASAAYLELSGNTNIEKIVQDMALIMAALHGVDTGDTEILMRKLSRLIDEKNAWRHSAKELSALLAQKLGNKEKANKLYKELSDDATAPSGIRTRATEMTAILGE